MNNAPQITTNTALMELNCINATGAKLTSKNWIKTKTTNGKRHILGLYKRW